MPNLRKASPDKLLNLLNTDIRRLGMLTYQAIIDRNLTKLTKPLHQLARDSGHRPAARIRALWALRGLERVTAATVEAMLASSSRNLRREAIDALESQPFATDTCLDLLRQAHDDPDPQVRTAVIFALRPLLDDSTEGLRLLLNMTPDPPTQPVTKGGVLSGKHVNHQAFDKDYQRFLIRDILESRWSAVRKLLRNDTGQ